MAKKSVSKLASAEVPSEPSSTAAETDKASAAQDVVATGEKREPVVKVNTANLSELKNAVDDVVKEFFSHTSHRFSRSFMHEDVRLTLGWSAVAVAAATGYYGYKTEFHESKGWVGVGVIVYVVLNTLLALYVAYFEQNTIFVGKRRTFASRISTEHLTLSSLAASSPTHTSTSSWVPFPISLLAPSPKAPTSSPSASSPSYPLYSLTLTYRHSANANKSLLHANTTTRTHALGGWFDAEGRLARRVVEEWLEEGLREVVGAENGQGGGKEDGLCAVGKRDGNERLVQFGKDIEQICVDAVDVHGVMTKRLALSIHGKNIHARGPSSSSLAIL
ncbi:hypothetical protein JCM6882_002104 [Rhodosporidiobolus microsporus]